MSGPTCQEKRWGPHVNTSSPSLSISLPSSSSSQRRRISAAREALQTTVTGSGRAVWRREEEEEEEGWVSMRPSSGADVEKLGRATARGGATMVPVYSREYPLFFYQETSITSIYTHVHKLVSQVLFLTKMRKDERFRKVKNLPDLSIMIVETKLHNRHEIVYKLLKLVLVLSVAVPFISPSRVGLR